VSSDLQTCSDGELVWQCQNGSLTAFEELVYRYEARIYGFVSNACGNPADARELTQDTFVRAYQAIARFDCRRAFAPWLFTIARRKCIDRSRSAEWRMRSAAAEVRSEEQAAGSWELGADEADPGELLARQEERQCLWDLARRRLSKPQFEVIWLRYVESMSVADIAEVLHKTQTHVKVLLFRARRVLARELRAGQGTARPVGRVASWAAFIPGGQGVR
jgi:RNA polymerase sigma-70 factor, ECF subfamily